MRTSLIALGALVLLAGVVSAQDGRSGLVFSSEGGTVRAKRGEAVVWENHHDRLGRFRGASAKAALIGPMPAGTSVYYAIAHGLYRANAATGVVEQRWYLPSSAVSLAPFVDGATVTCRSDMSAERYDWERTYRVGPDSTDLPPFYPAELADALPRLDAEDVGAALAKAAGKTSGGSKLDAEVMKLALPELEGLAKRHPTNPWYEFVRGKYLVALGQREAGLAAFDAALSVDPAYHVELLRMALELDGYDPARGDKAFDMGLRWLLERGFEPELNQSLLGIMTLYGKARAPDAPLDQVKDIARLNVLGQRLADLCPRAEGVTLAFHALALANEEAREAAETDAQRRHFGEFAARWRALAVEAEPYRMFGGANLYGERAGHALTAMFAGLAALLLVLVIGSLRVVSRAKATPQAGLWRFIPFRFWRKLDILGLLLLAGGIGCMAAIAGKGVRAIGFSAAMPITTLNGSLAHPDTLEYLEPFKVSPEGRFIYALALQQAGDLDAAEDLYKSSPFFQAQVNRGVIAASRGDSEAANSLWHRALERRPRDPVASYNLGVAVDSPRASRRSRYGLRGPMLALPTARMGSEAYAAAGELNDPVAMFTFGPDTSASGGALALALGLLLGGAALVVFVSLLLPRLGEEQKGKSLSSMLSWGLSALLPGTARVWVGIGPMLLALFLFCALVGWTMSRTGYPSVLEALSTPSLGDAYGIPNLDERWLPSLSRHVAALGSWWLPLLLLNLLAIGIKETRCPDPGGPFSKEEAAKP